MTPEKQVLVVDDDEAIRTLVTTVLRRRGLTVETARNGAEALDHLRTSRPLVVLLDLMMPVMNGWDVLDHLERVAPSDRPVVIVLSAGSEPRAFKADLVAGMVRKPFDIDLLVDTVSGCIASLESGRPRIRRTKTATDTPLDIVRRDELN
jgi:CheY-like chemotaxis protein